MTPNTFFITHSSPEIESRILTKKKIQVFERVNLLQKFTAYVELSDSELGLKRAKNVKRFRKKSASPYHLFRVTKRLKIRLENILQQKILQAFTRYSKR